MKDKALKLALEALDIVKIHFTQNRHVNEAITAIQEAVEQPAQEPFGYFRLEPFGWTDCAETDEAARALYEAPFRPKERNFCPRCGKRTADLTTIHTCTPPRDLEKIHEIN